MPRRTRDFAGLVGAGLFALAALASGLDRISEYRPEVAAAVPPPFRVNAARVLAGRALAANQLAEATEQARHAVRRDPIDARSASLLGSALLVSGDAAGAERAFTVSAAMGWRDPATQLYWMSVALEQGDLEVASQRLDALLRQSPQFASRAQLLAEFEATAEGRAALARRLADAPVWGRNYFVDGYLIPPAGIARRGLVAEILSTRMRSCSLVAPTTFNLVSTGQIESGKRVWRGHCQSGGDTGNIADGSFSGANLSKPLTAFDWRWPDDGSIGLSLEPAPGFNAPTLHVTTSASRERDFATQLTVLAPGAYRAHWRAQAGSGAPAAAIRLSVACTPETRRPLASELIDAKTGHFAADLDVPAGCPAQSLAFSVAPGSDPVTLDDVTITRR